jgi:membrane fusion protein (multidrug efflux system)
LNGEHTCFSLAGLASEHITVSSASPEPFSISENNLPLVQQSGLAASPGQLQSDSVIQLRLPSNEMYHFTGHLDFMDNEVDSSTGTIAIRAAFDNPEGLLVPGQYVTVLISMSAARLMPAVPKAAVLEDNKGRHVFVVGPDSIAQLKQIKTGPDLGTEWAVESGLTKGENIIVQGIQKVRPGHPVSPIGPGQDARKAAE